MLNRPFMAGNRPVASMLFLTDATHDIPQYGILTLMPRKRKARAAKLGLGVDPDPVPPWEFRRQHLACVGDDPFIHKFRG